MAELWNRTCIKSETGLVGLIPWSSSLCVLLGFIRTCRLLSPHWSPHIQMCPWGLGDYSGVNCSLPLQDAASPTQQHWWPPGTSSGLTLFHSMLHAQPWLTVLRRFFPEPLHIHSSLCGIERLLKSWPWTSKAFPCLGRLFSWDCKFDCWLLRKGRSQGSQLLSQPASWPWLCEGRG